METAETMGAAPTATHRSAQRAKGRALLPVGDKLEAAINAATIEAVTGRMHDAIVVGGGAAGGLAALLLTEAGLNVVVLDAGWRRSLVEAPWSRTAGAMVGAFANPKALRFLPPAVIWKGRRALKRFGAVRQPTQSTCYAWERLPEAFVDDKASPYLSEPGSDFSWYRAHTLGGRMVIPGHGRQYFRLAANDFAPADNHRPHWPFAADALDPWYAEVERRLGLSGRADGEGWQPDSLIKHGLELSPAETALHDAIHKRWPGAHAMLGRYAAPMPSLELAAASDRLKVRRGAMVRRIEVDGSGQTTGVTWHDRATGKLETAKAPLVFLCASSLETTRILMMSQSARSPNGLGGKSDALGRHLMDHVMQKAEGVGPGLAAEPNSPEDGRCTFLPRFNDRETGQVGIEAGFGVQVYQTSGMTGQSWFTAVAFAEMAPRADNRVTLDPERKDAWGAPVLRIACTHGEADLAAAADRARALADLAEITGTKLTRLDDKPALPGSAVHECGTARMGEDPAHSVLDPFNACWDAKGLYVTDGAAMPSQGFQNPTLTIMALTARAVDHALKARGAVVNQSATAA